MQTQIKKITEILKRLTHTHKTFKNSGRRGFTYYNPTSNFQKFQSSKKNSQMKILDNDSKNFT